MNSLLTTNMHVNVNVNVTPFVNKKSKPVVCQCLCSARLSKERDRCATHAFKAHAWKQIHNARNSLRVDDFSTTNKADFLCSAHARKICWPRPSHYVVNSQMDSRTVNQRSRSFGSETVPVIQLNQTPASVWRNQCATLYKRDSTHERRLDQSLSVKTSLGMSR